MTESEEMYLVTIARLEEAGEEIPVPLSHLANELAVQSVSANQMIRKLEDEGWVRYIPYKGVDLTDLGRQLALQILRHRRLWEVFLVEQLKILPEEASEIACRMEHFFSASAAERLAAFLGNPLLSPRGLPIPAPQTAVYALSDTPLTSLLLDGSAEITRIEADPASRTFLYGEGISPGETVRVVAIGGSGSFLLQTQSGRCVHLSESLAKTLWVKTAGSPVKGK